MNALPSVWAFVKHHVLTVYSLLFFAYLLLPIAIVIAFSFNNPAGRFLSLEIALVASVIATALGTAIALALVRYVFRGRAGTNILVFLPLSTPEIVLGASLLALFLNFSFVTFGFWTILIAHVMFCISFAS